MSCVDLILFQSRNVIIYVVLSYFKMNTAVHNRTISIKLWHPSQSTRLMLVGRMTKNLTTSSVLPRNYVLQDKVEGKEDAKRIYVSAFEAANEHFDNKPDGNGCSAVQLYAKEFSKFIAGSIQKRH